MTKNKTNYEHKIKTSRVGLLCKHCCLSGRNGIMANGSSRAHYRSIAQR